MERGFDVEVSITHAFDGFQAEEIINGVKVSVLSLWHLATIFLFKPVKTVSDEKLRNV